MLRFTLNVVNAKELDIAFSGLVAQIRDWRPLWPYIMNLLHQKERSQFAGRGTAGEHGLWAGYKHTYGPDKVEGEPASLRSSAGLGRSFEKAGKHSRKSRSEFGARVAFEADRLYNSLAGKTDDTIEVSEPLRMQFGTAVPYALYHQTGTKYMAARRLLDLTEEDRRDIQRAIQRQALNFTRRLGFKVAMQAGFRDVTPSEARQMGVTALAGGPGSEWVGAV